MFGFSKKEKNITVDVMSRVKMETLMNQLPKNACVISINSPGTSHLPISAPVLYLDFRDTEDSTGISESDADRIVRFVHQNIGKGNVHIYVHCEQGISRSAGVAAAILQAYGKDTDKILDCSDYCINARCYELVLKAFHVPVTDDEIADAKHRSNCAYMQDWPIL